METINVVFKACKKRHPSWSRKQVKKFACSVQRFRKQWRDAGCALFPL